MRSLFQNAGGKAVDLLAADLYVFRHGEPGNEREFLVDHADAEAARHVRDGRRSLFRRPGGPPPSIPPCAAMEGLPKSMLSSVLFPDPLTPTSP